MEVEDLLFLDINLENEDYDYSCRNNNGEVETLNEYQTEKKTKRCHKPRFSTIDWETENNEETVVKSYKCKICKKVLSTKELLRKHILCLHLKLKPFECHTCKKKFAFEQSLDAHKEIHSVETNYLCICGKSYKVYSSYIDHIKRIHNAVTESPSICEFCLKSFVFRKCLKIHINSVHKEKKIKCSFEFCDKLFSSKSLMNSHYRCHSTDEYICLQCEKSFKSELYLQKHQLTHSGIRPYKCNECLKSYMSVSHLNQHRKRVHSERRSFLCSTCGKSFNTKEEIVYHENAHVGLKKFGCDVCDYKTCYRGSLYAHKKIHMKKEKKASLHKKISEKSECQALGKPSAKLNICAWDDFADENLFDSSSLLFNPFPNWDQDSRNEETPSSAPLDSQLKKSSNLTLNCTALDRPDEENLITFASPYEY